MIIDSDYRGEVIVALHNDTEATQTIEPHERIAQFVLMPYIEMEFTEFESLSNTERGSAGFGSTGAK
jgi:dUTP pyrophosphatase